MSKDRSWLSVAGGYVLNVLSGIILGLIAIVWWIPRYYFTTTREKRKERQRLNKELETPRW